MNQQIHYQHATTLLRLLKERKVSSVELTQQAINRIKSLNPTLNAIVVSDFEAALQEAKKADALIALGRWMPLLGLPITIKESFSTRRFPTTWGNPEFKDFYAEQDALAVQRLQNAGAIILGKSNVPFMLKDWQTKNPIYGLTKNPWDLEKTCGGSSGGSAVALASGMVSLELGSDLAGSIRVPAHFCGIYSHKPSCNLIPLRGSRPPNTPQVPGKQLTFPVTGPMARSAQDLKLMLDVLAGPDPLWEGRGYHLDLAIADKEALKDYKILVINKHPLCPLSDQVQNTFNQRIAQLKIEGCEIDYYQPNMPSLADITKTYVSLFASYGSAGLSDSDYAMLQQMVADLNDIEVNSIQAHILKGLTLTQRDFLKLEAQRELLKGAFIKLFDQYDVMLAPVMPTVAFPLDFTDIKDRKININGELLPHSVQYAFVSIPTAFGLPSTIAPIQTQADQLPVGMQIIGNFLDDYQTIHFAELMEQAYRGFIPPVLN